MVRDHDAVRTERQRGARIVRFQDALDHHRAVPLVADPLQVAPADGRIEIVTQPADIVGQSGYLAAIGRDIAQVVRAAVQAHVPGPARVRDCLQHAPQRGVGAAHAAMGIAVACARDRHIDGEYQRGGAQRLGALQDIAHEGAVLEHIELEPQRLVDRLGHLGQRAHRHGGLDERNAARTGCARSLHLAPARIHAGQAHRRQRDRHAVGVAEPLGGQVQVFRPLQDALAQVDLLQVIDIGAQGLLGAGAAVEVMEQEGRKLALRDGAEIGCG